MSQDLLGTGGQEGGGFEAVVVVEFLQTLQKLHDLQSTKDAEDLQALDCHLERFGKLSDWLRHSEFVEWRGQQSKQEYEKN